MASYMRILTKNSLANGYRINALIENLIIQQRQISTRLAYQIEDFIEKRQTKKTLPFVQIKSRLKESINLGQIEENKNMYELYKNQFLNYIYHVESLNDLELVINFLKINKDQIIKEKSFIYSIQIFKLLYVLDAPDKSLELFNDQEIGELFQNTGCSVMLMLQLDEKERFQDVLEVFEVYFNKKKSKQLSPDNLTLAERNFFPTLTENHVNLVCRALFQLNSIESMEKLSNICKQLDTLDFKLSFMSVIHAIMLASKQNQPEFASKLFRESAFFNSEKSPTFVNTNLKVIIHSSLRDVTSALDELEILCKDQSEFIKDLQNRIFPFTLNCLEKAIVKETNEKNLLRYEALLEVIKSKKGIVRLWDMNEYSEFLAEKEVKKNNKRQKDLRKTKLQKLESNKTLYYKNDDNASIKNIVSSNSVIKPEYSNSKSSEQSMLVKYNSNDQYLEELRVLTDQNTNLPPTPLRSQTESLPELRTESQSESQTTAPSSDYLIKSMRKLFRLNKFSEVEDLVCNNVKSAEFITSLSSTELSFITSSLLQLNSKRSIFVMKQLSDACIQNKVKLSDTSKIHLYLLACFQNEPHYGLGYLVMSGLKNLNENIFINLKTIAYIQLKKFDQVFKEIQTIQAMPLNVFNNSGCVFRFVIDYMIQVAETARDQATVRKSVLLKTNLTEANRFATLTLADYCMTRKDTRDHMNHFFESVLSKKVDKLEIKKAPINYEEILQLYENKNYYGVLKTTHEILASNNKISVEHVRILVDSILNDKTMPISDLRALLEQLNHEYKINFRYNDIINIFLKLVNMEPIVALEFLANNIESGEFQKDYPSVYENILVIGFSAIGKISLAISRMESIAIKEVNNSSYEGLFFPLTIDVMEKSVTVSDDKELKDRFAFLKEKIISENRKDYSEINCLNLVEKLGS